MTMKKILIGLSIVIVIMAAYVFSWFSNFQSVSEGAEIEIYDNPQKALLIIDIQRAFTEIDGHAPLNLQQTDQMIKNINKIINNNDKLNLKIVYITQEYEDHPIINMVLKGKIQHGDPMVDIDPRIKKTGKIHFIKHIQDSFSNPDLDAFLTANRVNQLYVTGLDACYCVDKTVKASLNRKYLVTIISDAIATETAEKRNNKLYEFKELGATILSTQDVISKI